MWSRERIKRRIKANSLLINLAERSSHRRSARGFSRENISRHLLHVPPKEPRNCHNSSDIKFTCDLNSKFDAARRAEIDNGIKRKVLVDPRHISIDTFRSRDSVPSATSCERVVSFAHKAENFFFCCAIRSLPGRNRSFDSRHVSYVNRITMTITM